MSSYDTLTFAVHLYAHGALTTLIRHLLLEGDPLCLS